ncbi:sacsin N-terminal ATP-binding-like domain-containing protein [Candidatus Poriferisodalis sp.]|uniref:sacsin N-terminal ATP-binding-like domain-containing protein n=1 Tax=Candidatus Poriferisodalis sp. TaxID=3101277 RepID=UPI003B02D48F
MIDKDHIRSQVLVENNAQSILNHLKELESNRARMQTRWIWELLQNARDACDDGDTRLIASVELGENEVIFEHNGRGFAINEVVRLIYHGSTKAEDENTIGQYGSGFLTTHLLSPAIDISGQLVDGQSFQFRLERPNSSAALLQNCMEEAWEGFRPSTVSASDGFSTRFRYSIDDDGRGVAQQGIAMLKRCAPFVVVFNRQFHRIDIALAEATMSFEVVDRRPLPRQGLQLVTVRVHENDGLQEYQYLVADGTNVEVAIPMRQAEDGLTCLPLGNTPRLFLGFPLIGTDGFSFPAIINSFEFTPTEHRDGVYLGQNDNTANRTNQLAIVEACQLHLNILQFAAEAQSRQVYRLANVPPILEQSWFNSNWLHQELNQLIGDIRDTAAVCSGGGPITPRDSVLPIAQQVNGVEVLWDLMNGVEALRARMPARSEVAGWCEAVRSWEPFMGLPLTSLDEAYGGDELARHLEDVATGPNAQYGTLDNLQNALHEDVVAKDWLNQFHGFLRGDALDEVIRNRQIVPDQAGYLDRLADLYRDTGVDDELKNIADDFLSLEVRARLRHAHFSFLSDETGKGDYGNQDLAQEIATKLRKLGEDDSVGTELVEAAPRFLDWVVANEQWAYLTRFPAYSIKSRDGDSKVLWLDPHEPDDSAIPLGPTATWVKDLQDYTDLFPWQYIMADDFLDKMPREEAWVDLCHEGYIRTDAVFCSDESAIPFLPDEPLAEGEHRAKDPVRVTDVSFLTKENSGVMERVRSNQGRAQLFWRFLTEWLAPRDSEALIPRAVDCECGDKHHYYQAKWLMPVVNNRWVPLGRDTRAQATAQSLANLLRDSGWTPDVLSDLPATADFLRAIAVTHLDLIRHFIVDNDESRSALDDAMTEILVSTGGDLRAVREFVEDMKTDENLHEYLVERREQRRVVHENQQLGAQVEDLVREGLENRGFAVRRTGIGSDFEIDYDVIYDEEEMGIEFTRNGVTWLVEVKATREQSVRMTPRQAKTAVDEADRFLLCVVPVGRNSGNVDQDHVLDSMRFVQSMGPRLRPLCEGLDEIEELRGDAMAESEEDIQLEIDAGRARLRIDESVWQSGIGLVDLISCLA